MRKSVTEDILITSDKKAEVIVKNFLREDRRWK